MAMSEASMLPTRRGVLAVASAAGAVALLPAQLAAAPATPGMVTEGTSIQPFRFSISDEALVDLKRRIKATSWPSRELVSDDTQGVRLATMQKLADYWANQYDWRKVEERLAALPQFVTTIDGVDIHFIHVKSKDPNALPVIITHGWPGSIIEQLKIIDPLTNPTAHGGTRRTRSTSSFRRSRATAFPASPRSSDGIRFASRAPGPS